MIEQHTSLEEIAFFVCTALQRAGVTVVLTGGGAATFYAPRAYQSRDLDFVLTYFSTFEDINEEPLIELGFNRKGDFYEHPKTKFTLDLLIGPVMIGNEQVTDWETIKRDNLLLNILTKTDSIRDRLCSFYFFNDFSALEQALAIAANHDFDMEKIHKWSVDEQMTLKFENFLNRLDS